MIEGWTVTTLSEAISFTQIGIIRAKRDQSPDYTYPYIRMNNIKNSNGFDKQGIICVNASSEEVEKYKIEKNDFLFNTRNSYELVGKSCLISCDMEKPYVFNNNIMRMRFKPFLLPSFVAYHFSTKETIDDLGEMKSGTTSVVGIYYKSLKNLSLRYPPIPEQKRIVTILDEAFAGIDQAIANTERNLANARELFTGYLDEVFTRKSEGWEEKLLGQVCKNLDSKRIPITKSKRETGEIPYYGASGVVDYVKDYIFDEDLLLISEDGANLLARTYPIAFSVSGKTWVNNHAHVLSFKDKYQQILVQYYLNSISLENYVSGMAQPKLNQKSLNGIPVLWCDPAKAKLVVNCFTKIEHELNSLEDNYSKKILGLAELKQSLLQKAFTGELTADWREQQA